LIKEKFIGSYSKISKGGKPLAERRIVIAGTGSGVGKTTLTIGIMAALRKKGYTVQGFKCGPDYIDPSYHTAVTKRVSRNLDSWMLSPEVVREILRLGSKDADIAIIEGVMGFFDGKDPTSNIGSTAEISMITKSPVILVVDASNTARSAAAVVKGFQCLSEGTKIVGVIVNQVSGEAHFNLVKVAIEQECNLPVIGYLKRERDLEIPERHLGLIPSIERGELDEFFDRLGELVLATIDLDHLVKLANAKPIESKAITMFEKKKEKLVRIAVAKDRAFNFYYQENLELLEAYGADIVYFSPLKGEPLPENVEGLYLGGGFPEEFANELAQMVEVKESIKNAIENGLPTLAECGGFMFLAESIETTDGQIYPMVGVIPGRIIVQPKLAALGYREVTGAEGNFLLPKGEKARGHEFHYSIFISEGEISFAYETKGMSGIKHEGYQKKNLVAGYTHFHFASNPNMVDNWIKKCLSYLG